MLKNYKQQKTNLRFTFRCTCCFMSQTCSIRFPSFELTKRLAKPFVMPTFYVYLVVLASLASSWVKLSNDTRHQPSMAIKLTYLYRHHAQKNLFNVLHRYR